MYLTAIIDWYSRRVLAGRVWNTLEMDACVEVLEEALLRYGTLEIFNTDQGAQSTSEAFLPRHSKIVGLLIEEETPGTAILKVSR